MKIIALLLTLALILFAQEEKQKVTIGAGVYVQTQAYENVDNLILPTPVIFFDNGLFYIRWSRAGLYFLGDKQEDYAWGFSLSVQPRTFGYDSSEIEGMDTRESTWEGGLAFSAKTDKAYIEIMLLTDMFDRYESWILKTEIGYDFKVGKLDLYPSLIVVYQSSDFINYYYGVKPSEAINGREEYTPDDGLQLGLQTYIKYPITDNLSTLVNLRVDRLPQEAIDSPIVIDNYYYSGLLSLIYTFEY